MIINLELYSDSVDFINFPTGEKHIRIRDLKEGDPVILTSYHPHMDLMKLGMAVDICRRSNVGSIELWLPFVPYARQDQIHTEGDPLSIKVFCDFVNSLKLDKVVIRDPHSIVTPALLDNCLVIPQYLYASEAIYHCKAWCNLPLSIVCPDLGAMKKIKELQKFREDDLPVVYCDKNRDPKTGKITGFSVLQGDPINHHCLIVDDICDGGGTFLGIRHVLLEYGAKEVSLFVTHGIFSKGVPSGFKYVMASDSLVRQSGCTTISIGDRYE